MNTFTRLALVSAVLVTSAAPLAAQQQIASRVDIAWNRYYDVPEVDALLKRLVDAYPELLKLESIGKSVEGRDIWLVTLNNDATGTHDTKPAMYIDGSVHANEIQATETTLYAIWYLASAYGQVKSLTELVDRAAFYFVPTVNPDGRAAWFTGPTTSSMYRSGLRPTDNDDDGRLDEDSPDDLTETGSIHSMWRKDPHGTHRRSALDPNRMERAPEGEKGEWSFIGFEGVDDDGDGRSGEDNRGGYDMNRNWPSDWRPDHVQGGAGDHPFSYPETKAVGAFVLSRPNIAAGQSYHNTGAMILRGPGASYREGVYPASDVAVYDALGRAGAEMLPFYNYWIIHADLYTVHGGFVNWLAEGLGIVSFTNELWTERRILQNGQEPDDEQRRRWDERVLFGQTLEDLKEYDHPLHGEVLIGGGTKFSSRIPPPFMLEEECHRNFAFTMFHAAHMPVLSIPWIEVVDLGDGLWQITAEIENDKLIPTRTAIAANNRIGRPDLVTLSGDGLDVVAAGSMRHRLDRTLTPIPERPARILSESGVPSEGRSTFRWFVRGAAGSEVTLSYDAEKATDVSRTFALVAGEVTVPE
jgi:hypothetical protein